MDPPRTIQQPIKQDPLIPTPSAFGLFERCGRRQCYEIDAIAPEIALFAAAIVIGLVHDLLTTFTALTNYRDMTPFVLAAIALLWVSRHRAIMTRSSEEA